MIQELIERAHPTAVALATTASGGVGLLVYLEKIAPFVGAMTVMIAFLTAVVGLVYYIMKTKYLAEDQKYNRSQRKQP